MNKAMTDGTTRRNIYKYIESGNVYQLELLFDTLKETYDSDIALQIFTEPFEVMSLSRERNERYFFWLYLSNFFGNNGGHKEY